MDLSAIQRLLAGLYTDDELRQRFSVNATAIAKEFGIVPEDARQLEDLSTAQVAGFARTLERKRLNELQRTLPGTSRALGSRLAHQFGLHVARFHPQGMRRGLDDAIAFANLLSCDPGRIADLARYELSWLQFRHGRTWPVLAVFRSDPRETATGRCLMSNDNRWIIAVWFRFAGRPRHLAIRLPHVFYGKKRTSDPGTVDS